MPPKSQRQKPVRKRQSAKPVKAVPMASWMRWAISFVMLLSIGSAIWLYLTQPGRLPLKVVEVNGEFVHLNRAEIGERVAAVVEGGFFEVDMHAVRSAVQELPWVEQVGVRRVWPDTLRMQVTEQVPLARWGNNGLVTIRGEVFRPQPLPDLQALPLLIGADEKALDVVRFYLQLHRKVIAQELEITQLTLNVRNQWQVDFANDLRLMLGAEQVEQRVADFLRLYPRLIADAERRPARIDMRYQHGFAVRWQAMDQAAMDLAAQTNVAAIADGENNG